ncbi:MAG TPA: Na+/H+ antiporter [Thermoleophilaceae bacterium]|nr:Na+/H+ antiporter [Thermoleophilaceae bacterium]
MDHLGEVLLGLMVAVAALSAVAGAMGVPYPILLVIGGLALGFVPGVPHLELEPELVLVLFLPPLLYSAAFFSNLRDLKTNVRPISLLAIGLVVVTTCVVAVVAHALIDGLPWAAAFALGAIVAPTDPLAATEIVRRLGAPRRLTTVVEGESLINDGTALTLYGVAVAAAVGGTFSLVDATFEFLLDASGGIAVGLGVGLLISEVRGRLDDPPVEITISLATGFAAYLPAEELGLSGVLAAVAAGIVLGWRAPDIASARMRIQGFAVWELLVFLLNAILFVLLGLQFQVVLDGLGDRSAVDLALWAVAVIAAVVGARMLWLFTVPYVVRAVDRRESQRARRVGVRERLVVGWSGMRGSVSMAAALALPVATSAGAPFPGRDVLIFLAYAVIVFTIVVQGLTLPAVIRRLGLEGYDSDQEEELLARLAAADAALERLDELTVEDWAREDTIDRARGMYEYRRRRFAAQQDGADGDSRAIEERSVAYQRLVHELIAAQRRALVELRKQGAINDEVMRRVQRELDLEESRLEI